MTKEKISSVLKWTARIVSVVFLVMFVVFAIGEGVDFAALSRLEIIMFACLGVALAGLLIALGKIVPGCVLVLGGWIGFGLAGNNFALASPFVVFPIIVCLYLVSLLLRRKTGFQLSA